MLKNILYFIFIWIALFSYQNCGIPLGVEDKALKYQCKESSLRGSSNKTTLRLSKRELINVLTDLFGPKILDLIKDQVSQFPEDTEDSPEKFIATVTSSHFGALLNISDKISQLAANDTEFINKYSGCSTFNSQICIKNFINNFISRAHRKSIPEVEQSKILNSYNQDPDIDAQVLIMSTLLKPEFILRLELGEAIDTRYRLSAYEVASRISFQISESIPDSTLWSAAKNNELNTLAEIRPHVERLVKTQRGKEKVKKLFRVWMSIKNEAEVAVTPGHIKNINIENYFDAAVVDFNDFIDYIVFKKNGTLEDLFFDESVFPKQKDLADVYGTSIWTNGEPKKSINGHKGILLRPASLIGGENATPIILRGVHLRKQILCDSLGVPNADIINARNEFQDPDEINPLLNSNRNIVKSMTESSQCMACHRQINPLGFALEDFDSLGRKQLIESVYDEREDVVQTFPVDSFALDPFIERRGAHKLDGANDLNIQLAKSSKVKSCFSKKITEQIYRRTIASEDECALSEKESLLHKKDLNVLEVIIQNVANEDIFWRMKE